MGNILVREIPNGWSMDVENHPFMYYNKLDLLKGFMYHVGLEELGALTMDEIDEFLAAAVAWKEEGSAIKKLVEIQEQNELLIRQNESMKKQLAQLRKEKEELKKNKSRRKQTVEEESEEDED